MLEAKKAEIREKQIDNERYKSDEASFIRNLHLRDQKIMEANWIIRQKEAMIQESEITRSGLEKNIADCSAKNLALEAKKKELMVLMNMLCIPTLLLLTHIPFSAARKVQTREKYCGLYCKEP